MKESTCRICYKGLGYYKHNNQVYCDSETCKKIAKETHNRVHKQNLVFQNIMNGKTCKRCKRTVYEKGMKKYCTKCRNEMEVKVVKKVETKKELCIRCKEKPKWSTDDKTKYCADCKKDVHKEQSQKKQKVFAAKRALEIKELKELNKTKKQEIDPKWLTRGPIE